MILTQPILFIHKPNKSNFPSDMTNHSLGIFVMQGMYAYCSYTCVPIFLGASFIKQEVQKAEITDKVHFIQCSCYLVH